MGCQSGQTSCRAGSCGSRTRWSAWGATCGAPMTKDPKIFMAAKNFFERFGTDAPAEAKKRAEELQTAGNVGGHATWIQIYEEVKALADGKDKTIH